MRRSPASRVPPRVLLLALPAVVLLAPGAFAPAAEEWMFDPSFREGRPADLLHDGPPPLLRSQLDAFVDLFEAAFDTTLAAADEQRLRDAAESAYGQGTEAERVAFAELVAPLASLRAAAAAGEVSKVEEGLSGFRRAVDARLTSAPAHVVSRVVSDVLAAARETVWPGTPPVPAVGAASWLDLTRFLCSLGRNVDLAPTDGQRDALRADLGSAEHGLSPAKRTALDGVPRLWRRLRGSWDVAGPARRLALRWRAARLVASALPPASRVPLPETDLDLESYARASAAVGAAQPGPDAWATLAHSPDVVLPVVREWLGPLLEGRDHPLLYR